MRPGISAKSSAGTIPASCFPSQMARTYFKVQTIDNKIYLKAQVIGDLGDLQRKIGTIVDTFKLPRDNCGSYSANNLVVSVPRKELAFKDNAAVFSISGSVETWDCRENPVPNSKVDFVLKDVGFGVKTKVPQVVTWPGDPNKDPLLPQPFDAALPVNRVQTDRDDRRQAFCQASGDARSRA